MPDTHALLRLLRDVTQQLDRDVSLESLARHAGWSRFHLHRELGALLGETPKRYTQRLRLATAAALLATTERSIGDVASAAGFASHAVFTRAFRRSLGRTPQHIARRCSVMRRDTCAAGTASSSRAPCRAFACIE